MTKAAVLPIIAKGRKQTDRPTQHVERRRYEQHNISSHNERLIAASNLHRRAHGYTCALRNTRLVCILPSLFSQWFPSNACVHHAHRISPRLTRRKQARHLSYLQNDHDHISCSCVDIYIQNIFLHTKRPAVQTTLPRLGTDFPLEPKTSTNLERPHPRTCRQETA